MLENITRKVKGYGNDIKQGAQNLNENSQLHKAASEIEKNMKQAMLALGEACYKRNRADIDNAPEEYRRILSDLNQMNRALEDNRRRMQQLKKVWACPKCHTENPQNALFCGTCGTRRPAEAAPAQRTQPAAAGFCAKCGAPYAPGTLFCGSCGTPVPKGPEAAPKNPEPVRPMPQPEEVPAVSTFTEPEEVPAAPTFTEPEEVPAVPTFAEPEEVPEAPTFTEPEEVPAVPSFAEPEEVPEAPTFAEPEEVPEAPSFAEPEEVPETPAFAQTEPDGDEEAFDANAVEEEPEEHSEETFAPMDHDRIMEEARNSESTGSDAFFPDYGESADSGYSRMRRDILDEIRKERGQEAGTEDAKCPNCGAVVGPEDIFCQECGMKIR